MMPVSPTTPAHARNGSFSYSQASAASPTSSRAHGVKRGNSSDEDADDAGNGSIQSTPGLPKPTKTGTVKRACNECRQQKLRCDVQQDPFVSCSRCRKHRLNCIIEANFKRIGKRSRHAEMEREITALRTQLSQLTGQQPPPTISTPGDYKPFVGTGALPENTGYAVFSNEDDQFLGSQQAVQSLLDLRGGSPSATRIATLGNVMLAPDRVNDLFREFFQNYHPFLPFLEPADPPEEYLKTDRLLFWTIITTAARQFRPDPTLYSKLAGSGGPVMDLLWNTLRKVPQSHHTVKALCLLCTWPLSTNRTSTDPTFMLCGLMMQVAMQIGLHQPTHIQDFSRFKLQLKKEDIHDRVRTWAVCNIVAQMVSTGYGQPPITLYDSILAFKGDYADHIEVVPPELLARLKLEMAADRISRGLYGNHDPYELTSSHADSNYRGSYYASLEADRLKEDAASLGDKLSDIGQLHLKAYTLHLHLYAFFSTAPHPSPALRTDLLDLYFAVTTFLDAAFELEGRSGGEQSHNRLIYATNLIYQMVLAAGFTLLKLLNSQFAQRLPIDDGKRYLSNTVRALRSLSVASNDLPMRLAEVLAQLWKASGSGSPAAFSVDTADPLGHAFGGRKPSLDGIDNPLGLKVRSRMSQSVVFDCVWRWRETQVNASERLDSSVLNNPTNPDSSSSSTPPPGASLPHGTNNLTSTASIHVDSVTGAASVDPLITGSAGPGASLSASQISAPGAALNMPLGMVNGLAMSTAADSYELFDSVSWFLDAQPSLGFGNQPEWNASAFGGFGAVGEGSFL